MSCSRGLQRAPEGSRELQRAPESSRVLPSAIYGFRALYSAPEHSRVLKFKVFAWSKAWAMYLLPPSGICQKRQNGVNLNSLFITLRTDTMERIPLRMGILNLLHEILHAFGASHDPKGIYNAQWTKFANF